MALLLPCAGYAQPEAVPSTNDQLENLPLPPDVRLVIDVSGSMKRNDPNNLRQPAVDLLVQLLPPQSKAGVWTFGRWVNMLVKHRDVDAAWRAEAGLKSKEINSLGLFTNIGEALEKAAHGVDPAQNSHRTSIILLTDGMVDIAKDPETNSREWRRIVDEVLPKLKAAGITVHTVALSDTTDTNLLSKLSLATDGIAEVAMTAEDLMRIFLKAFAVAAPMEQVPLSEDGFTIDSSVEEFTALIFRSDKTAQTTLIAPDQESLSAATQSNFLNWYRTDKYDLITVKQPFEGQWQVRADMAPGSRITVVSNLNLRVRPLPNNVLEGQQEDITFLLQEDGKTIDRAEFLSLMSISASLIAGSDEFDLREIWRQELNTQTPPANGIFKLSLPSFDKAGIYQLSLLVDGKSFIREFNHQFETRKPFGAEIEPHLVDGRTEYLLTVKAHNPGVIVDRTQIVATVLAPDQRKKIRPLVPTEVDTWETSVRPDEQGEYSAIIKVRGENEAGETFDLNLEELKFNYSLDEGFVEAAKPFFEATPAVTPAVTPTVPTPSPAASPEPTGEPIAAEEEQDLSSWMLYGMLGIGNLVLIALGFLLFRKILKGNSEDEVLSDLSDTDVVAVAPPEPEPPQEDLEEEPPMEDLDPSSEDDEPMPPMEDMAMDDSFDEPEMAAEPEPSMESDEDDFMGMASLDEGIEISDDDAASAIDELGAEDSDIDEVDEVIAALDDDAVDDFLDEEPDDEEPAEEDPMDALDDLEQMAVDAETAAEDDTAPQDDDEEDMVTAMLKAQGLDLAEDELDDAISSLINELENEDTFDDDEFS